MEYDEHGIHFGSPLRFEGTMRGARVKAEIPWHYVGDLDLEESEPRPRTIDVVARESDQPLLFWYEGNTLCMCYKKDKIGFRR